jgi:hypothetical protein
MDIAGHYSLPPVPSPAALSTSCQGWLGTSVVVRSSQYWQFLVPAAAVCFSDLPTAAEEHLIGI